MKRSEKRQTRRKGAVSSHKNYWMKQKAKELNSKLPKSEQWFLEKLKENGINLKFKQNIVCFHYIIDFKYQEIAIEIDGTYHDRPDQQSKDRTKNKDLTELGFNLIRVRAYDEVSLKACINKIKAYLKTKKKTRNYNTKKLEIKVREANKNGIEDINNLSSYNVTKKATKKEKRVHKKNNRPKTCMGCHKTKATKKLKYSGKGYNFCDKCFKDAEKAIKIGLI